MYGTTFRMEQKVNVSMFGSQDSPCRRGAYKYGTGEARMNSGGWIGIAGVSGNLGFLKYVVNVHDQKMPLLTKKNL